MRVKTFLLLLLISLSFLGCETTEKNPSVSQVIKDHKEGIKEFGSQEIVVAKVGDKEILRSRLYQELERSAKQADVDFDRNFIRFFAKQVLDELINETIFLELFEKHEIESNKNYVDEIVKQLYDDFQAQNTLDDFLDGQGYSLDGYIKSLHYETQVQRLFDRVYKYETSDFSQEAFIKYNKEYPPKQLQAIQVVFKIDSWGNYEEQREIALQRAKDVIKKAKEGIDFQQLAKDYSDEQVGNPIGFLDWFGYGQMVDNFERTAFDLGVNNVSEPIETQYGFHVIKIVNEQPENIDPKEYRQRFIAHQREQHIHKTAEKFRNEADVEIFEDKIYY
ncbi:MAG: hypothetical protein DWQ06_12000 [Calditrichaeota bacterium]|nr:MAG: hypothetical protein DWQ06_12000 [Calditrichota bacterium]